MIKHEFMCHKEIEKQENFFVSKLCVKIFYFYTSNIGSLLSLSNTCDNVIKHEESI